MTIMLCSRWTGPTLPQWKGKTKQALLEVYPVNISLASILINMSHCHLWGRVQNWFALTAPHTVTHALPSFYKSLGTWPHCFLPWKLCLLPSLVQVASTHLRLLAAVGLWLRRERMSLKYLLLHEIFSFYVLRASHSSEKWFTSEQ